MKAIAIAVLAAAPLVCAAQHVAVISVDGLGASELGSASRCLAADATIRKLAKQGAWAEGVTGVLPTVTYPSHATLVTGADPVTHGVIDNGAPGRFWLQDRADIRADTLWDAAQREGRTVAIVTWPSTYGAQVDWLIPEDLAPRINPQEDIRKGATPGLFDALSAAVGAPALMHFGHPDSGTPLDRMTATFAAEVVRRHKPRLLLAHFLDYDHRMHAAPFTRDDACQALARIDAWIAHLVGAYREAGLAQETTFFIVSDHGFVAVERSINAPAMLRQADWEGFAPGKKPGEVFEFKYTGGALALYPLQPQPPEWMEKVRAHFRPRLERAHGDRLRWIAPEQASAWGGFPGAAMVLCARPGITLRAMPEAETALLVEPGRFQGAHGYCPDEPAMDAVFVASGRGVRAAGNIGRLRMKDVAPTIAAFVGAKLRDATGADQSRRLRAVK